MWQRPDGITIRELRERADIGRAYITIVTTLNRLRKKGLVDRIAVKGSKVLTFRYVSRYTGSGRGRATAGFRNGRRNRRARCRAASGAWASGG